MAPHGTAWRGSASNEAKIKKNSSKRTYARGVEPHCATQRHHYISRLRALSRTCTHTHTRAHARTQIHVHAHVYKYRFTFANLLGNVVGTDTFLWFDCLCLGHKSLKKFAACRPMVLFLLLRRVCQSEEHSMTNMCQRNCLKSKIQQDSMKFNKLTLCWMVWTI